MGIGTKTVWKCDVCGHEWLSRNDDKPLRCASCKSPYWNKTGKIDSSNKIKNPKIRGDRIK